MLLKTGFVFCLVLASASCIDLNKVPDSILCKVCEKIVDEVGKVVLKNGSEADIIKILEGGCSFFHFEKKPVCVGVVDLFKGEVFAVLKHAVLNGSVACGRIFESRCSSPASASPDWSILVPGNKPAFSPPQSPKAGSPVVRIVQLTDPHVDLQYAEGTKVDCGEPLCCRKVNGAGKSGKWGDVMCDPPMVMLENLFQHLSTVPMDFLYMTGDLPAHNIWNQSRADQLHVLNVVCDLLKKYLPNVQVYPSLGNHESSPVDSFPPPSIKGPSSNQWLLDGLADAWKDWLPEDALETIRYGGYYAVRRPDGLRIISLNFNYCNNLNLWLLINATDPAGQLGWLIDQLLDAEKHNEKVHIIGHIPPGNSDCIEPWSKNYHRIVTRFQNTIAAQFFGHTHHDELEVFFDEDSADQHASNIAYISPSVTTYQKLFPAYRIYDVDGAYENSSRAVLDHHNFWMNVTDANLPGHQPQWKHAYSARDAYAMESTFPRDWADFVKRTQSSKELFSLYYMHKYHGPGPFKCNDSCRKKEICAMLTSEGKVTNLCP